MLVRGNKIQRHTLLTFQLRMNVFASRQHGHTQAKCSYQLDRSPSETRLFLLPALMLTSIESLLQAGGGITLAAMTSASDYELFLV